jgi:hypothetical protein
MFVAVAVVGFPCNQIVASDRAGRLLGSARLLFSTILVLCKFNLSPIENLDI